MEGRLRSRCVVAGIPELRGGAGLLPVAGLPGRQGVAPRQGEADLVIIEATARRLSLQQEWKMAKGYWIGRIDVSNEDGYKPYAAANPAIFKKFGGKFVVRAGRFESVEGGNGRRNVVIEFPSYADAMACYKSPEYQAISTCGSRNAIVDLIVIEGYDGPQP